MYDTDRLYQLIVEELKECVEIADYELQDGEDYEQDLMNYEDDIKSDILCNNDFDWFGENGRYILAEYADCYEGHSYETLARALTDVDFAIDIIWRARFDEAIEDLMELFVQYHKSQE